MSKISKLMLLFTSIIIILFLVIYLYIVNFTSNHCGGSYPFISNRCVDNEVPISKFDTTDFGGECIVDRTCGDLVGINCDAHIDGPYYYVNRNTKEIVSRCGGYCLSPNANCAETCPPKEWSCN